ncbi:MAG: AAA family ATPase [Patescibacteria group bacterium]|jgi:5S rRNA maturation endonuclease (ribonuclease M5)
MNENEMMTLDIEEYAHHFNAQMPADIKKYLNNRGISDQSIDKFQLGYAKNINGFNWISIPVKNSEGEITFIKLRKEPGAPKRQAKYLVLPGGSALFNSETLKDGDNIFICEGELDCIVLDGQGIKAVSSTAGATTFKDSWIDELRNTKQITICFDNDETGGKESQKLAERLSSSLKSAKIFTINLPAEVGDRGDITDYFSKLMTKNPEKYNTGAFLKDAVEFIPAQNKEEQDGQLIKLVSAHDLANTELHQNEWLITNFLVEGGVMVLSANPGDFKTWLALHLADCVSTGKNFLEKFTTSRGSVLIIDEENSEYLLQKRIKELNIRGDNILFSIFGGVKVDKAEYITELADLCSQKGVKLIIFDSLTRVHSKDEDNSSQMKIIFESIKPLLKLGVSIIFTHHHRKSEKMSRHNMRGSSEIAAFVNSHFSIERKDNKTKILTLINHKMRDAEPLENLAFKMVAGKDGIVRFILTDDIYDKPNKEEECIQKILEAINKFEGPLDIPELLELFNREMGETRLRSTLKTLTKDKKIGVKREKSNRHLYYSLEPTSKDKKNCSEIGN